MNIFNTSKKALILLLTGSFYCFGIEAHASLADDVQRLEKAYPDLIKRATKRCVTWIDGTETTVQDSDSNKSMLEKLEDPSLADQIEDIHYPVGNISDKAIMQAKADPGRIRYEPFFEKMYGYSQDTVKKHLRVIYWMPKVFGKRYPLEVTTVNGIDQRFQRISDELEKLPRSYYKYLANPGGTYNWRVVDGADYLSPHSYGIAIDINPKYSNYWEWDLEHANKLPKETTEVTYHNQIPFRIVEIFEKNGFIWGGKWYHYDTMHFEYRPELLPNFHA